MVRASLSFGAEERLKARKRKERKSSINKRVLKRQAAERRMLLLFESTEMDIEEELLTAQVFRQQRKRSLETWNCSPFFGSMAEKHGTPPGRTTTTEIKIHN
jgi:hypothetical protein